MNIDDIELLEKQKNLKYYKKYISQPETTKFDEYNALNLTTKTELGIGKDILKFYEMIV